MVDEPVSSPTVGVLGFGCSGLMARLGRRQSLRLLEAAWDSGIRHFDTAPLYGYGEAEGLLGEFLVGRRPQAKLVTKLGILPPRYSRILGMIKPLARRVAALYPPLRTALRHRGESLVQPGAFDVGSMRRSLETSLRHLRTEQLDLLLLHECGPAELAPGPILDFLRESVAQGRIRGFGIATDLCTVQTALAVASPLAAVVQFPSSAFDGNIGRLARPTSSLLITHSPLGPHWASLRAALERDRGMAVQWRDALGLDACDPDMLGRLFIAAALRANPGGGVLFSSTDPQRIARNVQAAHEPPPPEQLDALLALARRWAAAQARTPGGESAHVV